jgi:hypothetical protein
MQVIIKYHQAIKYSDASLGRLLMVVDENKFSYNLETSFHILGDFQDIRIHFVKKPT